ncbi:hypothetical protein EZV73_17545 [Acidaminobacter sp. JC074]|uniref:hypothetical protein n=1 Tax=Acidaminobacter sp. JC074 TaxID=2530199 RepID=UPI001F109569|nr:hypothetical protein [Acidaminobacter sp. JC074]MCH4889407.1 hypothetical protein [Acidaminobacter sp. JC074]
MDYLKNELERQIRIYNLFLEDWVDVRLGNNQEEVIKWFYELTMFIVYHFYTQEVYLSNADEYEHIEQHHLLLSKMFSILLSQDKIITVINDFLDSYEIHLKDFDRACDFHVPDESKTYFQPSDSHGGFIVISFKKGYYSVAFGALTNEVASNYILGPSVFESGWVKFVDLRR